MATRFKFRLYLLALLVVVGVSALVFRLYQIQVVEHQHWLKQLPGEKEVTVRVPGVRGEIRDRNGMILATNEASYDVTFDLREIEQQWRLDNPDIDRPKAEFDAHRSGMLRSNSETDMVEVVNQAVIPRLEELGLAKDFNATKLQMHYRGTRGIVPFTYRRGIDFADFARFAENDYDLTGVDISVKPSRIYPLDALASHILGYVKLPDIETVDAAQRAEFNHYVPDDYGGAGIEMSMDRYLRGKPGRRVLRKDEKGSIREEIAFEPSEPGADVYLTIDARIQYAAEIAVRGIGIRDDPETGGEISGRAAAVVIDPRNGDILAMVSTPSFNPNDFVPSVSVEDWDRYLADRAAPMFNRALSQHPPGSTFKIPIALAGCLSDSHLKPYFCGGGVQYGKKYMKCWIASKGGRHGSISMSDAIKKSCNCYFYQYGNDTGIDNINIVLPKMGLGRKTGIPLDGEAAGRVPSPNWLRIQGLQWSDAFTAMTSIGQGYAEATPLQMASVTATVASGGKVYQPRLIREIIAKDGETLVPNKPVLKYDLAEEGLTADELELVKRGMFKVVNEQGGTAGRARAEAFIISGKTGTAQTGIPSEPTDAWFIAFAPYDEPEFAVCIYVHNGYSGGSCAAPVAGNIIKQAMAIRHGENYDIGVKPVAAARGHFDRIELVQYDDVSLEQFVDGDDADAFVELPEDFVVRQSQPAPEPVNAEARPSIRDVADERGSVQNNQQSPRPKWRNSPPPTESKKKKKGGGFNLNPFKKKNR
ncbi:MAG: penicillin-binding protein 2 [Verrucomicrobiales bacterium]|jgi:penicillin-binding protein 2